MRDLLATWASAFLAGAALPLVLWTALALVSEAALRLARAHAALSLPVRSALLAALPTALVAGPLVQWLTPAAVVPSFPAGRIREAVLPEIVVGAPAVVATGPSDALVWVGAALAIAALISTVALVRLIVAYVRLARLDLPDASDGVQARAAAALLHASVRRDVRVVTGGDVPMTFGVWRPVLVIPAGLRGDALDLALAHEAAHLRADDFGWHLASRAVAAAFAAHPLAHLLVRGQSLDRERLADAAVLTARPRARRAYAELLVSFSSCPTPRLALGVAAPPLLHRLTAMTRPQLPHHVRRFQRLGRTAGLGALMLVVGLAMLTASPSAVPQAQTAASTGPVSIEWTQPDGAPRVVVTLPSGRDRAAAVRVADEWSDPTAPGSLTVRYDGGQVQRTGVRADRLPPPPPVPPPSRRKPDASRVAAARDTVFDMVGQMPEIEGGLEALLARLVYPPDARADGASGTAVIRLVVAPDGSVGQITVVRSAGDARLDSAAVQAVRAQPFVPGRRDGRAVAVRLTLPVQFAASADQGARPERGVVRYAGVDLSRLANGAQIQAMIDALPARLEAEGVSYGDVRVEYLIDPDGTTSRFRVTSGPLDLHEAAVSIARALRTAEDARPGAPVEGFFRLWYTAG